MKRIEDGPRMTAEFTGPCLFKGDILTPAEGVCTQLDVGVYREKTINIGRDLYEVMRDKADALIAAGEVCPFGELVEAARLFTVHEVRIREMLTELEFSQNCTVVLVP